MSQLADPLSSYAALPPPAPYTRDSIGQLVLLKESLVIQNETGVALAAVIKPDMAGVTCVENTEVWVPLFIARTSWDVQLTLYLKKKTLQCLHVNTGARDTMDLKLEY